MSPAPPTQPTAEDLALVADEEALASRVRAALQRVPYAGRGGRDEAEGVLDPRAPYLARLRIRVAGRERDVLLAPASFIPAGEGVALVDWNRSPMARIYFSYREGDAYEEELEDRVLSGEVVRRHAVTFEDGELKEIRAPGRTLRRTPTGWVREPGSEVALDVRGALAPTPLLAAVGRHGAGALEARLDPEQRKAYRHDGRRPLLVLGAAGSGKTTVAVHRLSHLHHTSHRRFRTRDIGVVVPEPGVVRVIRRALDALGLEDSPALTYDEWVFRQARRAFPRVRWQPAEDTPARVLRFKRHPAMRVAIDAYLSRQADELAHRLDHALLARGRFAALFRELPSASLEARLDEAARRWLAGGAGLPPAEVRRLVAVERVRLRRIDEDLVGLLGDRPLLDRVVEASEGALTPGMADEVIAHVRSRMAMLGDAETGGVEPERLVTADGRTLDEGTPAGRVGAVDPEDLALLFEINLRRTGEAAGRMPAWAHLVVDEAQELSPMELALLGRAAAHRGLTVTGDAAQQVDEGAGFVGWDGVLDELGATGATRVRLGTTYRCPTEVAVFAHRVLGPLAPPAPPDSARSGPPVVVSRAPTLGHAAVMVADALGELGQRERGVRVAVVCRTPERAALFHRALTSAVEARLVLDGEFGMEPGVEVTDISQIHGLEFDLVVLPDVSEQAYPETPVARRALHLAATRAAQQLWVVTVGTPPPAVAWAL